MHLHGRRILFRGWQAYKALYFLHVARVFLISDNNIHPYHRNVRFVRYGNRHIQARSELGAPLLLPARRSGNQTQAGDNDDDNTY